MHYIRVWLEQELHSFILCMYTSMNNYIDFAVVVVVNIMFYVTDNITNYNK